jgi:hypothetical protein
LLPARNRFSSRLEESLAQEVFRDGAIKEIARQHRVLHVQEFFSCAAAMRCCSWISPEPAAGPSGSVLP